MGRPGIAAMYDALVETGHGVRLVGSAENYIGVSVAIGRRSAGGAAPA